MAKSKHNGKPVLEGTTTSQTEQAVHYVFGRAGAVPLDDHSVPGKGRKAVRVAKKAIETCAPKIAVSSLLALGVHLIFGISTIFYLIGYILGIMIIECLRASKSLNASKKENPLPPLVEVNELTVKQNSSEAGSDLFAWDALVYKQYGVLPDVKIPSEQINLNTEINASMVEVDEQIAVLSVMSRIHHLTMYAWAWRVEFMNQFDPNSDAHAAFTDTARKNADYFCGLAEEANDQIERLTHARKEILANLSASQVKELKRSLASITAGATENDLGRGVDRSRLSSRSQKLIYQSEALIELRSKD